MRNVLLLHHDLEWTEKRLIALLPDDRLRVTPRDVRNVGTEELHEAHVVLNRVYASVANRDFASVERALALCEAAQAREVRCVNSLVGCRADYDKRFAATRLREAGVATPETLPVDISRDNVADQISAAMDRFAGPVVFKRNTGGRAHDVFLITHSNQARTVAAHARQRRAEYPGEWIIQEYAENVRGFDCRVAVVRGQPVFAYARTLVNPDDAESAAWLASVSRGSRCFAYEPTAEEIALAVRAAAAIDAQINEVDLGFTAQGPVIIENNPTPQYVADLDQTRFPEFVAALRAVLSEAPP